MSVRFTVAGKTVRFFSDRKKAIQSANGMTRLMQFQHEAYLPSGGYGRYLVKNTHGELFDADGKLPPEVTDILLNHIPLAFVCKEYLGGQGCRLEDTEIGQGIRWSVSGGDYTQMIHKDDVEKLVERVTAWRKARGL